MATGRASTLRLVATTWIAGAAYGASLGAGKNVTYAAYGAVKLPLLLLGTGAVCCAAHAVLARFLGVPLGLAAVATASLRFAADLAVLLASIAPVSLLLARTMVPPSGRDLGGYPGFVATNMVLLAVAGSVALRAQIRAFVRDHALPETTARGLALAWLLVSLAVGGQLAFWLRPFFGIASLTGAPRFLLGNEPTVTGARNFYEVVWQFVHGVALPFPAGEGR